MKSLENVTGMHFKKDEFGNVLCDADYVVTAEDLRVGRSLIVALAPESVENIKNILQNDIIPAVKTHEGII